MGAATVSGAANVTSAGDIMLYTRRELGKLALATVPAVRLLDPGALFAQGKPNSKVHGVQIGLNVPYSFGNNNMPGDEVLQNCIKLGVSGVELRSQPVEAFMGVPAALVAAGGRGRGTQIPEQDAARTAAA